MKLIKFKLHFEAENPSIVEKEIVKIFYEIGVKGVEIEGPVTIDPLDYHRDEYKFLQQTHSVSAYLPFNMYIDKKINFITNICKEKFENREDLVYSLYFEKLDDEEYQNSWKKYLYPKKVSQKFVVKPTWRAYDQGEDEIVIELDPGRAFGTGSHPTTSLCLKQMEKYINQGDSVIDIGTGSGLLMIAADKLKASKICGVDIDEMAIEVTRENLELNSVSMDKIELFHGNFANIIENKKFDVVIANILADVIIDILSDISKIVKDGGFIILSGIIKSRSVEMNRIIRLKGYKIVSEIEDKEWICFVIKLNNNRY